MFLLLYSYHQGRLNGFTNTRRKCLSSIIAYGQGLCTKSTLSKLEKGQLNPNVLVSFGLLERLGLSSREFTFYGTQEEAEFIKIKHILSGHYMMDKKEFNSYVDKLTELAGNNPLMLQQCYLYRTNLTKDRQEIIDLCQKAISLSIPDFDLLHLSKYRFSWAEMTLINIMLFAMAFSENALDVPYYYQQIYQYSIDNNFELLWKKNHLAVALSKYTQFLGENKMYKILLARFEQWDFSCCYFHLDTLLNLHYYLSQAYHSEGDIEKAQNLKSIATSLAIVLNNSRALELIERDLAY